jgi:hypothetical protein
MPDKGEIVINTGPLIALTAALDDFSLLGELYSCIYVPYEVEEEIRIYGADGNAHYKPHPFQGEGRGEGEKGEGKDPTNQVYNVAVGERTTLNQLYNQIKNALLDRTQMNDQIHEAMKC